MLTLHSLRKTLPGAPPRLLLDAVDLSVAPGEYVAVIGESGAGKSTLLNLVAGLDRPDAGSVHFGAHAVSALDDDAATLWRRVEVGFVFQSFHVLPWLSLADNVALPLALAGVPAHERAARARAQLAAVGLGERAGDSPTRLSGGELQRVAIARALVHRPRLLLADEPTGNLDSRTADGVFDLMLTLSRTRGTSFVIVTHDERLAARTDRTVRLVDGRF